MQVKVGLEVSPCVIVDFKELLCLACQFVRHLGEVGESFEVIRSEAHISL